jgi:hypothetical protein
MPNHTGYAIVTGYWNRPEAGQIQNTRYGGLSKEDFFDVWWSAIHDNSLVSGCVPKETFIIDANSSVFPKEKKGIWTTTGHWRSGNKVAGNLGHPNGPVMSGPISAVMMGGMMALHAGLDMIYVEQDCIPCGLWVQRLTDELGENGMIVGNRQHTHINGCSMALMMCKHEFIPRMIELLCRGGNQLAEKTIQDCVGFDNRIVEMKMGWDKGRPRGWADNNGHPTMREWDKEPFYVQKLQDWELKQLRDLTIIP